jgi:hypothetical protein
MLAYYPNQAHGRDLLNQRMYLKAIGLDTELAKDDHAIDSHLDDATKFFEVARKRLRDIVDIVGEHIAKEPYLDAVVFRIVRNDRTLENMIQRITDGVDRFREVMLEEMKTTRERGIFQVP